MNFVPLLGRALLALDLLWFGSKHFTDYDAVRGFADYAGVPAPGAATIIGGVLLIVGALSVLLGFRAKIGALLLIVFLLPAAFMVHDYWNQDDEGGFQEAFFFRNLAFIGASLLITYFGSGPLSLDEQIDKRSEATTA